MNGRYKIALAPDETPEQNVKVKALIKMFDPGAKWTLKIWNEPIEFGTTAFKRTYPRYVEIRAHGGKVRKRTTPKVKVGIEPLKSEQIEHRLKEAQSTLASARSRLRSNLKAQYLTESYQNREWMEREVERRVKHKAIGKAIARILARHGLHAWHHASYHATSLDYAELDAVLGRKVERASKISDKALERSNGYLGYIVRHETQSWRFGVRKDKAELEERYERPNAIQSFQEVKAEVDYLEELYLLAVEREIRS